MALEQGGGQRKRRMYMCVSVSITPRHEHYTHTDGPHVCGRVCIPPRHDPGRALYVY